MYKLITLIVVFNLAQTLTEVVVAEEQQLQIYKPNLYENPGVNSDKFGEFFLNGANVEVFQTAPPSSKYGFSGFSENVKKSDWYKKSIQEYANGEIDDFGTLILDIPGIKKPKTVEEEFFDTVWKEIVDRGKIGENITETRFC